MHMKKLQRLQGGALGSAGLSVNKGHLVHKG